MKHYYVHLSPAMDILEPLLIECDSEEEVENLIINDFKTASDPTEMYYGYWRVDDNNIVRYEYSIEELENMRERLPRKELIKSIWNCVEPSIYGYSCLIDRLLYKMPTRDLRDIHKHLK